MKYLTREIVMLYHLDFKKHCKVLFGSYVEAHDDLKVTKNINPRKQIFISLVPTINIQGNQKSLFLETCIVLNTRNVISMVEIDLLIRKVNQWCKKSKGY